MRIKKWRIITFPIFGLIMYGIIAIDQQALGYILISDIMMGIGLIGTIRMTEKYIRMTEK